MTEATTRRVVTVNPGSGALLSWRPLSSTAISFVVWADIPASSLLERTLWWETSSGFWAFPTTTGRTNCLSENTTMSYVLPLKGKSGPVGPSITPLRM